MSGTPVWVLVGTYDDLGINVRLAGPSLRGALRVLRPTRRMIAVGCDRCIRRHSSRNYACQATSGVKVRRREGTVYNVRTGTVEGRFTNVGVSDSGEVTGTLRN